MTSKKSLQSLSRQSFEQLILFFLALGLFIFVPTLSLQYWQGWLYWIIFIISCAYITVYFLKNDPDLIESRLKAGPTAEKEKSQRIIQGIASFLFMGLFILSGIDHHLQWSSISPAIILVGDLMVVMGFLIVFLVFKENTYTSATIELQKEQKVISSGPYKIVRHPMYSGAMLLIFFTPISLGSWWGIILALLMYLMIIIRLLDEEKYLTKHLPGYKEYIQSTHYRLIPYVW